jgi:hypothetical protein
MECTVYSGVVRKGKVKFYAVNTADELLVLLKIPDPKGKLAELYLTDGCNWHVTYFEGLINPLAVAELQERNLLTRVYTKHSDCLWLGTKSIDVEATVARRKKFNNPKLGCVWVNVKTGIEKINKSEEQRAIVSDKSELAFELYQKLGNQRLVAKEMRCSHQNVSFLIKKYKLYRNIARKTRRIV